MREEQATRAEQAYTRIYAMIMSGELPLGGTVNEVTLAREFGISRGPVREAIGRLQGVKLVSREPYFKARVVSMSKTDIIEIFEIRQAVEGMACRLAVERMSEAALSALLDTFDQSIATDVRVDPTEKTFDLHLAIARDCGNQRIQYMLGEELYHLLRLYRRRSSDRPERHSDAMREHWQILRAMQARDAALAESLMRSHIGRALDNVIASSASA